METGALRRFQGLEYYRGPEPEPPVELSPGDGAILSPVERAGPPPDGGRAVTAGVNDTSYYQNQTDHIAGPPEPVNLDQDNPGLDLALAVTGDLAEATAHGNAIARLDDLKQRKRQFEWMRSELDREEMMIEEQSRRLRARPDIVITDNSSPQEQLHRQQQSRDAFYRRESTNVVARQNLEPLDARNEAEIRTLERRLFEARARQAAPPAAASAQGGPAIPPPPAGPSPEVAAKTDESVVPPPAVQREDDRRAERILASEAGGSSASAPMPRMPQPGETPSAEWAKWLSEAAKPSSRNIYHLVPYYGKSVIPDAELAPEIDRPLGRTKWNDPLDPRHFNVPSSMTELEKWSMKQGTPTLGLAMGGITFTTKLPPAITNITMLLACALKLGTYAHASNRWDQAETLKHSTYIERLRDMASTFSFSELLMYDAHMRIARHQSGDGAWDSTDEKANIKYLQVPMAERLSAVLHQTRKAGRAAGAAAPKSFTSRALAPQQSKGKQKQNKRGQQIRSDGPRKTHRPGGNMSLVRPSAKFSVHGGKPICKDWNWGRCTDSNCTRAHVCSFCKGNHPVKDCPEFKNKHPADSAAGR